MPELQKETIEITSESQNERNRPTNLALVLLNKRRDGQPKIREIPNMALVLLNIEKRVPEKSAKNTERKGVPELQKETIGITSEIKDSQNERNRPTNLALVLQVRDELQKDTIELHQQSRREKSPNTLALVPRTCFNCSWWQVFLHSQLFPCKK